MWVDEEKATPCRAYALNVWPARLDVWAVVR